MVGLFLINDDDRRLCQDKRWRQHVPFGSELNCLMEYKHRARAIKRARRFKARVVSLPENITMDAAGCIYRILPETGTRVWLSDKSLSEFVIFDAVTETVNG